MLNGHTLPVPDDGTLPTPERWDPILTPALVNGRECMLWRHDKLGTLGFAVGCYSTEAKNAEEYAKCLEDIRRLSWVALELFRLGREDDLRKMGLLDAGVEYARSDGVTTYFEKVQS
jgi:hypothetical protein